MIINSNLLVNNPEIIKGLLTGEMTRYGSTIRWAKGIGPYPGSIVKNLVETPGIANKLISLPISPLSGGVDIIGHTMTYHKLLGIDKTLGGMSQTLSKVMGLSQIAAGASVLNIGISAAGFAYMGYKLHQMQNSINDLKQSVEQGFDKVNNRLDKVSEQLAYIYFIVQDSRQKQEKLALAISHLYQASLIKEISMLQSELNDRKRYPNESPRQAIRIADQVRLFLSSEALKITPELEAELMLNSDISIQGWAVATATEANLLMEIGEFQEAKSLLREEVGKFKQISERWANKFLNDGDESLNTAYRFEGSPFENYIAPERVQRIAQIFPKDQTLNSDQIRRKKSVVTVEYEMSYSAERYNQTWIYQQLAIAEYLDTLSELLARLDTLQDFAFLCENQGVKSSKELLPSNHAHPGLYLLSGI